MSELRGSSSPSVPTESSSESLSDTTFIKRHDARYDYTSGPDSMQWNLMMLPCLMPCTCCFSRSYYTDIQMDSNKKVITHSQSGSCCFLLGLLPCFFSRTIVDYGDVANIVLAGPGACECVHVVNTDHVQQYTSNYYRMYIYLKSGKALPLTCRHRSILGEEMQTDFKFLFKEIFGETINIPDMNDHIMDNI
jgi:hypothetical protein